MICSFINRNQLYLNLLILIANPLISTNSMSLNNCLTGNLLIHLIKRQDNPLHSSNLDYQVNHINQINQIKTK
jgi:hypothetical protein